MKYLRSEHLKFKRTISNKLLWIAPMLTALFAWIIGGFYGFQYMAIYWWYAFLMPGTIAILCALSNLKEERAGNYYSVFSMPLDFTRFEIAKSVILVKKLLVAALFLSAFISISNLISPATAVYSVKQTLIGSIAVVVASIWQIPLCFFLMRKGGVMVPIIINSLLGVLSPLFFGKMTINWIIPYCWSAKLAEPLMGIQMNGTFTGNMVFSGSVLTVLTLSLLLFSILSYLDAKNFARGEVV